MNKEEIVKILSKIKDTVGENNYKLALAITGHKTGKIKDIIMCSKDGELLLKYIEQLEQQCKKQKEVIDETRQCIKDFLCSEEYINVDGDAIANNYENILDILKGEDKEVSE